MSITAAMVTKEAVKVLAALAVKQARKWWAKFWTVENYKTRKARVEAYDAKHNEVPDTGDAGGKPDGMHLDSEGPDLRLGVGDVRGGDTVNDQRAACGYTRTEPTGAACDPAGDARASGGY